MPQGTVLGPILFIAYINSLLKLEVGGLIVSYADDTALVFSGESWDDAKNRAINGMSIIGNWLQTNKLTMNLSKTAYIAFSLTAANRPHFANIVINAQLVQEVSQTRYLGIMIDRHLRWGAHVDYLSNKIRKLIHKFYFLR